MKEIEDSIHNIDINDNNESEHSNDAFNITHPVDFDDEIIISKKYNIKSTGDVVDTADVYTISDDGIFFLGNCQMDNGTPIIPRKKGTAIPAKQETVSASPFAVRNIINVHVVNNENIIYPAGHAKSKTTKKLVVQTRTGEDTVRNTEWPCDIFTSPSTAQKTLAPLLRDGYNITLTQSTVPKLNDVLNHMVQKFQRDNKILPELYDGSGWVFSHSGELLAYTQNGFDNNVSNNMFFGIKGDAEFYKDTWRHILTNTLFADTVQPVSAENKHLVNEGILFTACWSLASMMRIPQLANLQSSQVVNLQGPGGSGKSTAAHYAMSLFGNYRQSVYSDKSTNRGLEAIRAKHNHAPFFYDELTNKTEGENSNKRVQGEQLKQAIFDITELHQKRNKMTSDGSNFVVDSSRSVALNNIATSNHKVPLRIKEVINNEQDAAVLARLIEILFVKEIDKSSPDAPYATTLLKFTDKDGIPADAIRVSFIKEADERFMSHYGHAVPYFADYIKNNLNKVKEQYANNVSHYTQLNGLQNRQNEIYAMVDTMSVPFLTWLGFTIEEVKHIHAQLRAFIQLKVLPYNLQFVMGNTMTMKTEDAVSLIERIVIPRQANWYIKGAGQKRAYIMGNDYDMAAINEFYGKSYTTWSKEAQKDFVAYLVAQKIQNNHSQVHFTVECSREMTQPYQFEVIGISCEEGLFNTGALFQLKGEVDKGSKIKDVVDLARREGWLKITPGRSAQQESSLGGKYYHTFDLVKARQIIEQQQQDDEE